MSDYKAPIQNSILLENFHLTSLNFNLDKSNWTNVLASKETEFDLTFRAIVNDNIEDYFGVSFDVTVENKETTFKLAFTFLGNFKVQGVELNEEIMENHPYFRFSAPAIIFPYIRSFITSFSSNAGFSPVILPSINFTSANIIEDEN